jgi:hypothetical protein
VERRLIHHVLPVSVVFSHNLHPAGQAIHEAPPLSTPLASPVRRISLAAFLAAKPIELNPTPKFSDRAGFESNLAFTRRSCSRPWG